MEQDRRSFLKRGAVYGTGLVVGCLSLSGCGNFTKTAAMLKKEKNMDGMVGFCGLLCNECGAFIATKNDDDEKRAEVAQLWSKQYNTDVKPEEINCDGCISESGRLFSHCKVCEVRKCGKEKGVENCAYCNEYACQKLEGFFQVLPDAKKRLDEIRSSL